MARRDPAAHRAIIVHRAASASDAVALDLARQLAGLRNFASAARILERIDVGRLRLVDQCFVGVTLLSSQGGLTADRLLAPHLASLGSRALTPQEATQLGEWIHHSGVPAQRKIAALRLLAEGSHDATRRALRFREYRVRVTALERVDPADWMADQDEDPHRYTDNLRYVTDLVAHGHEDLARDLVARQITEHGTDHRGVIEAALRLDGGSLLPTLAGIPVQHRAAPGVLALAHDHRARSDEHRALFESCLAAATAAFPNAQVTAQDQLLRVLVVKDLLGPFRDLVPHLGAVPDTLLGGHCGHGLIALEAGRCGDAAQLLETVITEDPAFTAAATGLRYTYARLDDDRTMTGLRRRIGYGTASAGRPGVRRGDRDQATELLLTGQYLKSWSVRRENPHWRILKRDLGARFLNYEALPEDPGASLFVIADDGVGDEIRTAQYYAGLAERYRVTATCDPRLRPLLERSFPTITFVDVPRRIRGILNPIYDGRYADPFLASHLPARCDPMLATSDCITFGQNLTFNRFAGLLTREEKGAYLVPDPARAVTRSTGPLRVGLVWKSHMSAASRRMMYLGLDQLAPLLDVKGVEFWSVQHAADEEETAFCDEHGIRRIEGVDLFDDLEGLAAHLAALDLVIGISTVPMELAAAVGTPTWLLGFSPENHLYRTVGGRTEIDQLSRNSTVIAPPWIDFSAPYEECVDLVMREARSRLGALG